MVKLVSGERLLKGPTGAEVPLEEIPSREGTQDIDALVAALPEGLLRPVAVAPVIQEIASQSTNRIAAEVRAQGRTIPCAARCATCCHGLVMISPTEARYLTEVIEAQPEPRRSEIRARFASAHERIREAGLLERLTGGEEPLDTIDAEYVALDIACPFLEDESCSIYAERFTVCREHLVTSSAGPCSAPGKPTRQIHRPAYLWSALTALEAVPEPSARPYVPLTLAPSWVEAHPEPPPTRTGPEMVARVLDRMDATARSRLPCPCGSGAPFGECHGRADA
jgi:Fe-S-cluster containining protein